MCYEWLVRVMNGDARDTSEVLVRRPTSGELRRGEEDRDHSETPSQRSSASRRERLTFTRVPFLSCSS
jgi:hypothetical protein